MIDVFKERKIELMNQYQSSKIGIEIFKSEFNKFEEYRIIMSHVHDSIRDNKELLKVISELD